MIGTLEVVELSCGKQVQLMYTSKRDRAKQIRRLEKGCPCIPPLPSKSGCGACYECQNPYVVHFD